MAGVEEFMAMGLNDQVKMLYEEGAFIMSIRYYGYKINLFLFRESYIEVFYNHKLDCIEKIQLLDNQHSRMNFYADQIKVEQSGLIA